MMTDFKYKEITERTIGAAMKVHSTIGNGFQEVIYQRAMGLQMDNDGLYFIRECNMTIYYLNKPIGDRRVDFFAEVGLLINFGRTSLQFKRLTNTTYKPITQINYKTSQ